MLITLHTAGLIPRPPPLPLKGPGYVRGYIASIVLVYWAPLMHVIGILLACILTNSAGELLLDSNCSIAILLLTLDQNL